MGERQNRWYFGGLAAAGAACFTHPLDLLKVHLQTQQDKIGIVQLTKNVIKNDGVLSLYNGISASILRQLTYSMTRFGVYEFGKSLSPGNQSFASKMGFAALGGAAGGIVGSPADLVNVRMQNDLKLPKQKRRNYKHALDGLAQTYKSEGAQGLFKGVTLATSRATIITMGQLVTYDVFKTLLIQQMSMRDGPFTHFLASIVSAAVATTVTQPIDVLKTRIMNAKPGEYTSVLDVAKQLAKLGPFAFFKGILPAFLRIAPHNIITFQILEQLRKNFGYLPEKSNELKK